MAMFFPREKMLRLHQQQDRRLLKLVTFPQCIQKQQNLLVEIVAAKDLDLLAVFTGGLVKQFAPGGLVGTCGFSNVLKTEGDLR